MDNAQFNRFKDLVETGTLEIRNKIPKDTSNYSMEFNDFVNEMYDFRESETDYLIVLAEQYLERIAVAISNKTGYLIFVYKLDDFLVVFYNQDNLWKWELKFNIDEAFEFISEIEHNGSENFLLPNNM